MALLEDQELLKQIPPLLLQWWRQQRQGAALAEDPTPYRVWVSEIMLQQTRVESGQTFFTSGF